MQLNLAATNGSIEPIERRVPLIAELIANERIDVLVTQAGDIASIDQLACERHLHRDAGLAIIARPPIVDAGVHPLTRREDSSDEDAHKRALLSVHIGDMTIIDAHLSWVEAQAVDNITELLAVADAAGGDVLVVGDFNQEPASPAMRALEAAGFVDCWARLRHGEVGFTYEAGKPWGRIDYVWERAARRRVTSIALVGDIGAPLSDHFGLVAEIDG